jgi:hypothetical protein
LWSEAQPTVAINNGVFVVILGSTTPIPTTAVKTPPTYLGIKVGNDSEMLPRQVLTSVPTALRSHVAEFVRGESNAGDTPTVLATTTGTSNAGVFRITNPDNTVAALYGSSDGKGPGVTGVSTGTGVAGLFQINNSSGSQAAIFGATNGSGNTLNAINNGTGSAGRFAINNAGNAQPALVAATNGTGPAGQFYGDVKVNGNIVFADGTTLSTAPTSVSMTVAMCDQIDSLSTNCTQYCTTGIVVAESLAAACETCTGTSSTGICSSSGTIKPPSTDCTVTGKYGICCVCGVK